MRTTVTPGRTGSSPLPPPLRLVLRRHAVDRGPAPGFSLQPMTLHDGRLVRCLGPLVGEGGEGVAVGWNRTCAKAVVRPAVDPTGHKSAEDQPMAGWP